MLQVKRATETFTLSLSEKLNLLHSVPPSTPSCPCAPLQVVVLLISWLALGEVLQEKKAVGMALAVAGMVGYSLASASQPKIDAITASEKKQASAKLVSAL